MKKLIILSQVLLFAALLAACGQDDTYKVGATPVPHAEILQEAKPYMEEKGFEYEVIEFTDYVLPNSSLASGELIANFYQHIPYLESQMADHGYDFVNVGGVHVEPIGIYSKDYDTLETLPNDLELIISNSPSDRPRLLRMLDENSILTLDEDVTNQDIEGSSLNGLSTLFTSEYSITFTEIDAALLFTNYDNNSGDAVLINGNYALDNGLDPLSDAIALEGSASDYVNILVSRSEDEDDPFVKALIEVLQSEDIASFIEDTYDGAVIPVN